MESTAANSPPAAPSGAGAAAPLRWQFGLKDLFGLTTYCAAASALVVWFGPGTLMTSLGFLIAILNVRGTFARWQEGRTQWVLLAAAWVMFIVSLFLPCLSSVDIRGWQAAGLYLITPLERLWSDSAPEVVGVFWFWLVAMDLSNLLLACLPFYLWRLSRERGQWYAAVLCLAMTAVWSLNWGIGFYVGYFVWCASFHLVLVAIPLRWKTFLAMSAYVVLLAALNWSDRVLSW